MTYKDSFFWTKAPGWKHSGYFSSNSGNDLYKSQLDHLGNALLIDDYDPKVEVEKINIHATNKFLFPKDALISGSFVANYVSQVAGGTSISWDDVDIYFKTKVDAEQFCSMNNLSASSNGFAFNNDICSYGWIEGVKVNLIYGIEFNSPEHLISRFDIRACSMAIDPNNMNLYIVKGAVDDCMTRRIIFNPVPRGISVKRLTKYIKKGFDIEGYQSQFFAELIKTNIYKPELELFTKKY